MQSHYHFGNKLCECFRHACCICPQSIDFNAIFRENVRDVAESLVKVLIICGIQKCKAKASIDIIIGCFLYYDEIRHRVDAVPKKRLCREDLVLALGRFCAMNRTEAQLTYSIIKRAFKAFYYGTVDGGIRNPVLEAQLIHSQECMWVHAAKRTAQIFASYEGMFFSAQKHYEAKIKCVYTHLYDRLKQRANPVKLPTCPCPGCINKISIDTPDALKDPKQKQHLKIHYSDISDILPKPCSAVCPTEQEPPEEVHYQQPEPPKSGKLPAKCHKCNCPQLICDCDIDKVTGLLSAECSQGPYTCRWICMDEDEPWDPCFKIPEDHQCPVDCIETTSLICDLECECDCSDICECSLDEESSGEPSTDYPLVEENEEEVRVTSSEDEIDMYTSCQVNKVINFSGKTVVKEPPKIKEQGEIQLEKTLSPAETKLPEIESDQSDQFPPDQSSFKDIPTTDGTSLKLSKKNLSKMASMHSKQVKHTEDDARSYIDEAMRKEIEAITKII